MLLEVDELVCTGRILIIGMEVLLEDIGMLLLVTVNIVLVVFVVAIVKVVVQMSVEDMKVEVTVLPVDTIVEVAAVVAGRVPPTAVV